MPRASLRPVLAAALLALAAVAPAGAQHAAPPLSALRVDAPGPAPIPYLPAPAPYAPALQENRRHVSDATLSLGGIAGGALGFFGGGLLGYGVETGLAGCEGEWCGFAGTIFGAAIGEVVMLPLGVHLANRSRGSYAPSLGMSLAVGLGGLVLASAAGASVPLVVPAIPAAQILAAIAVERRTAARKQREIDRARPPT
ncbi:MAG TPA: hypothetical protein VGV85_00815 [Longimicrobiaceae bacterium]|nr:hypothetical protein [Longimicrobiaceae bacterium]